MDETRSIGKAARVLGAATLLSGLGTLAASLAIGRLVGGNPLKYSVLGAAGTIGVGGGTYVILSGKEPGKVAETDRAARASLSQRASQSETRESLSAESSQSSSELGAEKPAPIEEYRKLATELGEGYPSKIAHTWIGRASEWTLDERMKLLPHLSSEERRPMLALLVEEASSTPTHRDWVDDPQAIATALKGYCRNPNHSDEIEHLLLDVDGKVVLPKVVTYLCDLFADDPELLISLANSPYLDADLHQWNLKILAERLPLDRLSQIESADLRSRVFRREGALRKCPLSPELEEYLLSTAWTLNTVLAPLFERDDITSEERMVFVVGLVDKLDPPSLLRLFNIPGDLQKFVRTTVVKRLREETLSLEELDDRQVLAIARRAPEVVAASQPLLTTLTEVLDTKNQKKRTALIGVLRAYPAIQERFADLDDQAMLRGLSTVSRLVKGNRRGSAYAPLTVEDIHNMVTLTPCFMSELSEEEQDYLLCGNLDPEAHRIAVWAMKKLDDFGPLLADESLVLEWEGPAGEDGCRLWMLLHSRLSRSPWLNDCEPHDTALVRLLDREALAPEELLVIVTGCFSEEEQELSKAGVLQILRRYVDDDSVLHAALSHSCLPSTRLKGFGYGTGLEARCCQDILAENLSAAELAKVVGNPQMWRGSSAANKRLLVRRLEEKFSELDEEEIVEFINCTEKIRPYALVLSPSQLRQFGDNGYRAWMFELADHLENPTVMPSAIARSDMRLRLCRENQAFRRAWVQEALTRDCIPTQMQEVAALAIQEEDLEVLLEAIQTRARSTEDWQTNHPSSGAYLLNLKMNTLIEGLQSALSEEAFQNFVGKLAQ